MLFDRARTLLPVRIEVLLDIRIELIRALLALLLCLLRAAVPGV